MIENTGVALFFDEFLYLSRFLDEKLITYMHICILNDLKNGNHNNSLYILQIPEKRKSLYGLLVDRPSCAWEYNYGNKAFCNTQDIMGAGPSWAPLKPPPVLIRKVCELCFPQIM